MIEKRDRLLRKYNWITIRVDDEKFFKKITFYKYLIKDIIKIRRKQYNQGRLYPIDIPNLYDEE